MNGQHVLLVDPSPRAQALIAISLRSQGAATVAQASDRAEALRALADRQPDVIMLGTDLPDGQALALLRELRRLAPSAQVLYFGTGFSAVDRLEANRLGARRGFGWTTLRQSA